MTRPGPSLPPFYTSPHAEDDAFDASISPSDDEHDDDCDDFGTSPRGHGAQRRASSSSQRSPLGSPRSPRLSGSGKPATPRRRGTPGARVPSSEERRRKNASSTSPLAKRVGEELPFVRPHPLSDAAKVSESYPGVVVAAFAGGDSQSPTLGFGPDSMGMSMALDVDGMDDILDRSAMHVPQRQGSTSGQALAPNIAPWLQDDGPAAPPPPPPPPPPERPAPLAPEAAPTAPSSASSSRRQSAQLSHFASVPSLPKIRRHGTLDVDASRASGGGGGGPGGSRAPSDASSVRTPVDGRSRTNSHDSIQTVGTGAKAKRGSSPSGSIADSASTKGARHRFGSTVSVASSTGSGGDHRKSKGGFLGSFLKRKTGQSVSHAPTMTDFAPGARGSTTSDSASSKVSSNGSRSLSVNDPMGSYNSERAISPLTEAAEPEFQLDMNLDDMEGIVDKNQVAQPPATASPTGQVRNHASVATTSASTDATSLSLADALHNMSSVATTHSSGDSGGSGSSSSALKGRDVVAQAQRESSGFEKNYDFESHPLGQTLGSVSPKNATLTSSMPRRPSQLRNVKMGSLDSDASAESVQQPIMPAWAQASQAPPSNLFHDPFQTMQPAPADLDLAVSPRRTPGLVQSGTLEPLPTVVAPAIAPATAISQAWEAPQSWGVEADAADEDEDTTSSSSASEGDWAEDDVPTPGAQPGTPVDRIKPPPFGAKKPGASSLRPGTAASKRPRTGGRPSTSNRPGTGGRPGTSGSAHMAAVPHFTRIWRADGSYEVLEFPLMTTTAEIIHQLSGAKEGKKVSTSMRLYLRERGQDRQLLPSEKPLAIQARRLAQAGYTEAENIPELGKEDLSLLCKLIYMTPVLPVVGPEEESNYDSYELIDIAGRDLQVIPIFLHLHAHNIVILNVSRNPMQDIPLDFLQACTSLRELKMSNMALKRVPASIRASTTLARLDFSCNRIAELESCALNEVTSLNALKVQNNKLTSLPSYFAQMSSLKYLTISNNKFEQLPPVVCQMSGLIDLDVSFNQITELPSEMSNLKSLERLAMVGNEITTFPKSFSTLVNLRQLDVRRNKLVDLGPVYALPALETLRADSNDLVTLDAQIGARVKYFSVHHNSITRFTLAAQSGLQAVYALTHLDLSHGKLSTLADSALADLVNLKYLNLNFNQFTRLPSTIDRLVNLEVFSVTDNALTDLPQGFGKLQKLREINFHNNNVSLIPEDFWYCSSLETFNASSNLISALNDPPASWREEAVAASDMRKLSTVSAMSSASDRTRLVPPAGRSLRYIYLADNRLTDYVFHQIANVYDLKVLNLSFNDIAEIPAFTLAHNDKLERLYLSGNKLTSLPAEDLERLTNLQTLHLNGNKLQTLPSELGAIKGLKHLDVGSNVLKYNIANWPYDWNWNWNTSLQYLNLSGNKRLEIKPTSAQDMSHATFRKELSDFSALTDLRVLGLMDVTLRIPSLPDESDHKRVRTSFSDINHMAYGISDMLGTIEHLSMFDLAVPNFRGNSTECLFGMFGRAAPAMPSGKIPKFLQENFADKLSDQLELLHERETPAEALRRTFLQINQDTFNFLAGNEKRRKGSDASYMSSNSVKAQSTTLSSQLRTGSSGAVVYLRDKTLHVANAGDTMVVLCRKGEAELLSRRHDPTEREETARIRRAEAWVSTNGLVNDDKNIDISRAFGFYHALPAVNASPEVRTRQLDETDEFVIIGNHALWKVCSYQTAVDVARNHRDDPMVAAQKLRDLAIGYGARESLMVMVVNVSDLFGRGFRSRAPGSGPAQADMPGPDGWNRTARRTNANVDVADRTLARLQQEVEPPTGQVAIVFTDIVNSTALWETNPGMPTAIKMHHNLMRRQLRLDGGYEVKTEGDSFMVSFASVTAAVLWAFNCQIMLLQQEWPRELLESEDGKVTYDSEGNVIQRGLRVRMGVHWGSPECERDPITRRMDYYGPMVNRSARINASADGGQLMASMDVMQEILALQKADEATLDELSPEIKREVLELKRVGLVVTDMGERKLKGLEVPEKLHLLYPKPLAGRLEHFRGLRANVEVQQKPFTEGRQIDIEEVRQLVSIALRLEALSSLASNMSPPPSPQLDTHRSPKPDKEREHASGDRLDGKVEGKLVRLNPPAPHLGPHVRDDMTDDELAEIIASLTTRIENVLSTLYIKHLGGFASVLAALEHATRIDPTLLVHAMSLMSGAMARMGL
ncbi:cysteinyl-tRNA synthetase [Cryptotrichosporon argae]